MVTPASSRAPPGLGAPAERHRISGGAVPDDRSTELLLELAEAMHAAATPADVAEERLRRVADALGLDAQFFTLQSFFATELRRGGAERVEIRRIPFDTHWN